MVARYSSTVLVIKDLQVYYGAIQALKGVSLEVADGEIVAIIGSNGAGKSTLLRTISGLISPRSGTMLLRDKSLIGMSPDQIVRAGIAHAPEGRRIFTNMSTLDNLQLGAFVRKDDGIDEDLQQVLAFFPRLKERLHQSAGTLSGGEQQMLAIGRALMAKPTLMLMDEPSLGLAPNLVRDIFGIVERLNREGTTILLVEQNAHRALEIAHRGYVLETGKIVLSDTGANLLNSSSVKEAYLGGA
jgi:branched-chain amino acid transport system ATP-binding protein